MKNRDRESTRSGGAPAGRTEREGPSQQGLRSRDERTTRPETALGRSSTGQSADVAHPISLPSIEAPKGGGAVRSISERFQANAATGTGSMSVDLGASPGRNGFGPALSLSYDSGSGNGPFGLGWSIGLPSIRRKVSKGVPRYVNGLDTFVGPSGEDLIVVAAAQTVVEGSTSYEVERLRPRVERSFARMERWVRASDGDVHWRTYSPDDICSIYGRTGAARLADPTSPVRVYAWLLEEQWDGRGSAIHYDYKAEDLQGVDLGAAHEAHRSAPSDAGGTLYLKRVLYGNATAIADRATMLSNLAFDPHWRFEVVFDFGEHSTDTPVEIDAWGVRPDPFSSYRVGFEQRTYRLCQRVLMFHRFPELGPTAEANGVLVRSTVFTHGRHEEQGGSTVVAPDPVASKLLQVEQRGHRGGTTLSMPPVDFEYSGLAWSDQLRVVHRDSLRGIPGGFDARQQQWVDLEGEGLPGLLLTTPDAWWYKRPEGEGELGDMRLVLRRPASVALDQGTHQLTDLQGDGRLDVVHYQRPVSGFFEQTGTYGGSGRRTGFSAFKPFESVPNVDFSAPNVRFLDVTGDGRADLVVTEADLIVCYRSKGERGFEPAVCHPLPRDERDGPRVVFSDARSSIFTADMTGDGLADIVRIEPRRVCYWPNLGHGRFGARVTMSNAPELEARDRFDASRVRLVDLDGSGPTDLVYLHPAGVNVYLNEAGNGWADGREIRGLPLPHRLADVSAVDLLGRGTACLVWSSRAQNASPRLAYVDLFGRADDEEAPPSSYKPHLLVAVRNNLGAETRIRYTPSTKFYLETRGTPDEWVTRLHFPVQVVDRVEHEDFVSNLHLVQRFAYHHGYYDPDEREFNGFGLVEQWDEETYDEARGSGRYDDTATGGQVGWVPPVYSRSWFHTGAWRDRGDLDAALLARSRSNPDGLARLAPTVLPSGLSISESKDACRALRGQALRQEIYGLDGSALEDEPYVVTETQVEVHQLYTGAGERQSVFTVMPREVRTVSSERETTDIRVQRQLTLEIPATDLPYGHVRRTASVAFGRSTGPAAQTRDWILSTDLEVEHHDVLGGVYRLRAPFRQRSWEVTGASVAKDTALDAARTAIDGGTAALFSNQETLYWNAARDAERAAGETDPGGFVRRVRALAVPAALQSSVYGASTPGYASTQWTEGGHELIAGDVWAPSSTIEYLADSAFALPFRSVDPFGQASEVAYDSHGMFAEEAENALGHIVTSIIDYHALAPFEVVDANLNHVEAARDALGAVTAIARKGKDLGGGTWEGRTVAAPHEVYTYARTEWLDHGRPVYVRSESFVSHDSADTESIVAYAYADGGGATLLTKAQAEPGVAPLQDSTTGALIRDGSGNVQFTSSSAERWVGSGRVVLNNKGDPIKQYEPYFSSVSAFDDESELVFESPAVVLHYDPLGRPRRTQHPDGTEERVERFTWSEVSHDRSDTVAGSRWDTDAAASSDPHVLRARTLSLAHAGTPTTQHLDAMGRVFQVDEDNGAVGAPVLHTTTTELDIKGRTLSVTDARSNVAGSQAFDLLDRALRLTTADGGTRWMLPAVDGQSVREWDERDHVDRLTYDELRRPVSRYVAAGGGSEVVRLHMVYGEALGTAAAQSANLLGHVHEIYDGAGVRTVVQQDLDGNVTESVRRLRLTPAGTDPTSAWTAYALGPDWSSLPGAANLAALQTAAAADLETESFTHEMTQDALGRPLTSTTPDASVTRYQYNEAGLLDALDIQLRGDTTWTPFVSNIDYDPLGRRTSIVLGNGVVTTYAYDPDSRRLTNLTSQRSGGGTILQDLGYTYDAAGSIVAITDGAQQTTYFDNAVVSPDRLFEYDPRHRLVRAEGRCHPGQQPTSSLPPERSIPHPNDSTTLQAYIQTYDYDAVGNIMEMAQTRGGSVAWRRRYQYALDSNRLSSTSASMAEPDQPDYVDPSTGPRYVDTYEHDAHGSMTAMPGLNSMGWDADDRLVEVDLGGGGNAYYSYDATGQRIRKTIRRQSGTEIVERLYLDGWEVYRRSLSGSLDEAIETLHVIDDETRVCLVEIEVVTGGVTVSTHAPLLRYQLQDHLGTCMVEVEGAASAGVITYEEFFSYGASAYRASDSSLGFGPKRYRYTTKERDEETGLDYFEARYYVTWLGRWLSADPAGFLDGTNLYQYVRGRPIGGTDSTGLACDPSTQSCFPEPPASYSYEQVGPAAEVADSAAREFKDWLAGSAPGELRLPPPGWTPTEGGLSRILGYTILGPVVDLRGGPTDGREYVVPTARIGSFDGSGLVIDVPVNFRFTSDNQIDYDWARAGEYFEGYGTFRLRDDSIEGTVSPIDFVGPPGVQSAARAAPRFALRLLEKPLEIIGRAPLPHRVPRTLGVRASRFFLTSTKGYEPLSRTLVGRALKSTPGVRGLRWEQGHTFIQQRWFRPGSPFELFPHNPAARLGLRRLGNAGWNLTPQPRLLNRVLGRSPLGTTVFGAGAAAAVPGSFVGGYKVGTYIDRNLFEGR